jgi:hypothetical protein
MQALNLSVADALHGFNIMSEQVSVTSFSSVLGSLQIMWKISSALGRIFCSNIIQKKDGVN